LGEKNQATDEETAMSKYILFAFSTAHPDREAEYSTWYVNNHIRDMHAVPGVAEGRFYRAADASARWGFAGAFVLQRPGQEVMADLMQRIGTPAMVATDSIDNMKTLFVTGPYDAAAHPRPENSYSDLGVVVGDKVASDVDMQTLRQAPGIFSAQSLALDKEIAVWPSPWRSLVLCDLRSGESRKASPALDALSERIKGADAYIGRFSRIA
jgi:hypothetical protein